MTSPAPSTPPTPPLPGAEAYDIGPDIEFFFQDSVKGVCGDVVDFIVRGLKGVRRAERCFTPMVTCLWGLRPSETI